MFKSELGTSLQRFKSDWLDRAVLHIAIVPGEISVSHSSGILFRSSSVLVRHSISATDLDSYDAVVAQLRLALLSCGRRNMNLTITLDDALARMWIVTPPKNAASLQDCKAAAAVRFQTLFGAVAASSEWEIAADWDAHRSFLACAVARRLLDNINLLCAEFKLNLLKLEPHFVMTWNQYRTQIRHDAWLAILHNDRLTLGAVQHGRLVALRAAAVPHEQYHRRSWLDQHIYRESLLLNLVMPKQLQVRGRMPLQWQFNESGQVQCQVLGAGDSV